MLTNEDIAKASTQELKDLLRSGIRGEVYKAVLREYDTRKQAADLNQQHVDHQQNEEALLLATAIYLTRKHGVTRTTIKEIAAKAGFDKEIAEYVIKRLKESAGIAEKGKRFVATHTEGA